MLKIQDGVRDKNSWRLPLHCFSFNTNTGGPGTVAAIQAGTKAALCSSAGPPRHCVTIHPLYYDAGAQALAMRREPRGWA